MTYAASTTGRIAPGLLPRHGFSIAVVGLSLAWIPVSEAAIIAHYRFEETEGNAIVNSIGDTVDGLLDGPRRDPDVPMTVVGGIPNNSSLSFDGNGAARFFGATFILHDESAGGSVEATLEWFMKPADQEHVGVFWTQDGGGDSDRYNIHFQTPGLGADYREGPGANPGRLHKIIGSDIPLPLNEWSHIACVRTALDDGTHQYEWYVNGELQAGATTIDTAPNPPVAATWTISGRGGCCNKFIGLVDEIRFHDKALTPDRFLGAPCAPPDDCDPGKVGPFRRGDCNSDGEVEGQVTDAVFLLNYNFTAGPRPDCLAACDANGDGRAAGQVTDAVYLLTFNFLAGPGPVEPFANCATSSKATDAALGCEFPPASQGCQGG